ncbi:MAG: haloacid dehalogenase-like hydrolase [Megasphaera sp.]|nr:haloacid dehalogenase-like hydrolase [Megasphaera sp.]MCH4187257.1 haloacid dehalogenase-like hydrolase [Megasphaera sp.]MCH4217223.1 haloacid dehalogenase-like hydrolase [Megasphaera sp.]
MKLLYWDIDGTLLNTGRAGLYAIEEVFHSMQGDNVAVPRIAAGGRTDNYICQQLLLKATGIMPTDEEVTRFCRGYEKNLLKWLTLKKEEGAVFPPVKQILPFFAEQKGFRQLLLTGNSVYGAKAKLDFFHLSQYFDFDHSGFACNYYYRNDLARHAYDIAHETWGSTIDDIYVIGDTPYDIECGKVIGAKTISVATGHYSYDDLTRCQPWKQLRELPAPQELLELLV